MGILEERQECVKEVQRMIDSGVVDMCALGKSSLERKSALLEEQKSCSQKEKEIQDPWKHRSEGLKCKSCMWFAMKASMATLSSVGRCRRHAPTMNGYPVVFVNDWCGDHKLDENKV